MPITRLRAASLMLVGLWLSFASRPGAAWGQLPDLASVSAQYMPSAELDDPPANVQVTSYDAALNIPLPLGKKTFLIPGLAYHVESASFSDTPDDFIDLRAFHSLDLTLLLVQLLSDGWSLSFRAAPGLAGDFRGFDDGLVHMSGLALATRSFSERLVLGGGGIATFSFGTFLPLPALYLDWRPVDAFQIETFLPGFIDAKYKLGDRVEIGLRGSIAGNSYAVRDDRIDQAWPCAAGVDDPGTPMNEARADPSQCFDHVAYSVITAGPQLSVRLASSLWCTVFVGRSLYRRFEQRNRDDDAISGGVQDLPNAVFALTGVTWRIPRQ